MLLQRVTEASVTVAGERVAEIGPGLLVLVGFERGDDEALLAGQCQRLLDYRLFADDQGRTNRSLIEVAGDVLLVPQFTLAADTRRGRRPSFSGAASPTQAQQLYQQFVALARERAPARVASGVFAADMQVALINDGPMTLLLQT